MAESGKDEVVTSLLAQEMHQQHPLLEIIAGAKVPIYFAA